MLTLPPQQKQLRTESRTHRRQHAQRARLRTPVLHYIFKNHQNRSGRKVPDFFQAIPGSVELPIVQIERRRRRLQHFRTASMEHPTSNVATLVSLVAEKRIHVVAKVLAN